MKYSEDAKAASMKYIKDKQKSILIRFKKSQYEQYIEPIIKQSGMPVATYIKTAVLEKIERDTSRDKGEKRR